MRKAANGSTGGMVSRVGHIRGVGLLLACAMSAAACTSGTETTTSTVATTATSTTTTTPETTTTVPETTTTTSLDQRIAEVTEIVREIEFGWFDAIYRKDEAALADWVAVKQDYEVGIQLMDDESFFVAEPTLDSLLIVVHEVLIDRDDCLVVSYFGDATAFRGDDAEGETITALWPRPSDGSWRSAYQGDVWEAACNTYTRENQLP